MILCQHWKTMMMMTDTYGTVCSIIRVGGTPKIMSAKQDKSGQRFGRWLVLSRSEVNPIKWVCRCDCGTIREVAQSRLVTGDSQSCGCRHSELVAANNFKHGYSSRSKVSSEYMIWCNMKARCYNPNHTKYSEYGGRGIRVSSQWSNSFQNFYSDMGPRPGPDYSIDRIDVNGNYSIDNCRWATRSEQELNKRKDHA